MIRPVARLVRPAQHGRPRAGWAARAFGGHVGVAGPPGARPDEDQGARGPRSVHLGLERALGTHREADDVRPGQPLVGAEREQVVAQSVEGQAPRDEIGAAVATQVKDDAAEPGREPFEQGSPFGQAGPGNAVDKHDRRPVPHDLVVQPQPVAREGRHCGQRAAGEEPLAVTVTPGCATTRAVASATRRPPAPASSTSTRMRLPAGSVPSVAATARTGPVRAGAT